MSMPFPHAGWGASAVVGKFGIEKWGEPYLSGHDAASLYVVAADGSNQTLLKQVNSQPAASITLTIDSDLQQK